MLSLKCVLGSYSCLVTCQAPLFIVFPRQEYWSGLPFSSPGDLPNPGIELKSLALTGVFFTPEPPGKPKAARYRSLNRWHVECFRGS